MFILGKKMLCRYNAVLDYGRSFGTFMVGDKCVKINFNNKRDKNVS